MLANWDLYLISVITIVFGLFIYLQRPDEEGRAANRAAARAAAGPAAPEAAAPAAPAPDEQGMPMMEEH